MVVEQFPGVTCISGYEDSTAEQRITIDHVVPRYEMPEHYEEPSPDNVIWRNYYKQNQVRAFYRAMRSKEADKEKSMEVSYVTEDIFPNLTMCSRVVSVTTETFSKVEASVRELEGMYRDFKEALAGYEAGGCTDDKSFSGSIKGFLESPVSGGLRTYYALYENAAADNMDELSRILEAIMAISLKGLCVWQPTHLRPLYEQYIINFKELRDEMVQRGLFGAEVFSDDLVERTLASST